MSASSARSRCRLAHDLPAAGAPYRRARVGAAIGACMAAIEVVDDRYEDYRSLDTPTLVADDFFNAACVLGAPVEAWRELDLAAIRGRMTINGAEVGVGSGGDILGHPLEALAWLANALAARGRHLEAGDFVLLGSVVRDQVGRRRRPGRGRDRRARPGERSIFLSTGRALSNDREPARASAAVLRPGRSSQSSTPPLAKRRRPAISHTSWLRPVRDPPKGDNAMRRSRWLSVVWLGSLALGLAACGDTWEGVKRDTGQNMEAVGETVDKTGEKVEEIRRSSWVPSS